MVTRAGRSRRAGGRCPPRSAAAVYCGVPIVPLFGHEPLRERLLAAVRQRTLPASLLLHGPAGVGKQRLALLVAGALLCHAAPESAPCGTCQACRYMAELTHPDLHWLFPRPRTRDSDPDPDDIRDDLRTAVQERVAEQGLYAPPSGLEGLFVATVRAMLRQAVRSPAMGSRKVFLVGDAERMVPQQSSPEAANAFLKLLEEPPDDTTLILTSSEAGALLPTIRSRVVSVRVPPISDQAVGEFLAHPAVAARLRSGSAAATAELVRLAGGAPGRLLASDEDAQGAALARRLMEAARGSRARWLRAAASLGSTKARGAFASTLDHLLVLLHAQLREATLASADGRALAITRAVSAVEQARERSHGNVNPQLAGQALLRELAAALG